MLNLIAAAAITTASQGMPCAELTTLTLSETTITTAAVVPAGPFVWPEGAFRIPGTENEPPVELPEHCRVTLVLKPTADSNIKVELWLPAANWNGKFMAVGNGGWAGAIQGYRDMQHILVRGYATAATDTGHSAADGPMGMFALGHPEKVIDFAYRAMHLLTVRSKEVIAAYYPQPLNYSYYTGCSTGGRQGVMAAQRYPEDFDGIIAGALVNRHIHMHTAAVAEIIRQKRNPDAVITESLDQLLGNAVMKQCDSLQEGFLNNPRQCTFDFSSLQCRGAAGPDCLTPAQLETVKVHYAGVRNSQGELIFSGAPISVPVLARLNRNMGRMAGAEIAEGLSQLLFDTIRILGFQDPNYDWRNFDLDRDMPRIDAAAGFVDAVDPDLRAFKAHGGKLLLYHGWDDPGVSAENSIYYYESVLTEMGADQNDWLRLFMVPGMGHCRGGPGPHSFDTISALEQWREQGKAPDWIMGTNPQSGLTRPLCPYPQYAKYDGTGELKDGANWNCAAPK
jgi:feruloyl esterase